MNPLRPAAKTLATLVAGLVIGSAGAALASSVTPVDISKPPAVETVAKTRNAEKVSLTTTAAFETSMHAGSEQSHPATPTPDPDGHAAETGTHETQTGTHDSAGTGSDVDHTASTHPAEHAAASPAPAPAPAAAHTPDTAPEQPVCVPAPEPADHASSTTHEDEHGGHE